MAKLIEVARKGAIVLVVCAAAAAGGCAGPMYAGAPDDLYYSAAPPSQRSYVGADDAYDDAEYDQPAATEDWAQETRYEYRGGRDPATGRAKKQL
jgi:hypothetical protein